MADSNEIPDDETSDEMFDRKAIEADVVEGARALALAQLFDKAGDDWDRWEKVIRGFRGLRDLVRHATGARKPIDFAYRQEMGRLLSMKKYAVYDRLAKPQRSACYRLMDHIDDVSDWYYGRVVTQGYPVSADDRLNWKSPQTIIKHCPPSFLDGGEGKSMKAARPKPKLPKAVPPVHQNEIDRLRKLLAAVIRRLIKHDPDAAELLDQLQPPDLPTDSVDDL